MLKYTITKWAYYQPFRHQVALERWTEEGKLPVLDRHSFRKAGSQIEYPVFDRRSILGLQRTEIELWRAEYQALVKEHRKAGAHAAAARRRDFLSKTVT